MDSPVFLILKWQAQFQKSRQIMKILIVDDCKFFRQQLKDILKELGYDEVSEAEDGRIALQKLGREVYGLVFLDLEMPNVNGMQVLNAIRTHPSNQDLPVIMITSHAEKDNVLRVIKARPSSYIIKPIDKDKIEKKLVEIGMRKKE